VLLLERGAFDGDRERIDAAFTPSSRNAEACASAV